MPCKKSFSFSYQTCDRLFGCSIMVLSLYTNTQISLSVVFIAFDQSRARDSLPFCILWGKQQCISISPLDETDQLCQADYTVHTSGLLQSPDTWWNMARTSEFYCCLMLPPYFSKRHISPPSCKRDWSIRSASKSESFSIKLLGGPSQHNV